MNNARSLYSTVPTTDHLGFWADQTLKAADVVRFLSLEKSDVARIASVAQSSVRFDHKIPREVLERLQEIANVCALVAEFFDGDANKTALWFKTPNPQLGNLSPRDMIRFGRYRKLLQFVLAARDEEAGSDDADAGSHATSPAAASV